MLKYEPSSLHNVLHILLKRLLSSTQKVKEVIQAPLWHHQVCVVAKKQRKAGRTEIYRKKLRCARGEQKLEETKELSEHVFNKVTHQMDQKSDGRLSQCFVLQATGYFLMP